MASTGASGITIAWAGTPAAYPNRTASTATAPAGMPPLAAMNRIATRSTGPPATYDTFVAAPTATRKASPTSTIACRLHGSRAESIGASPRYHNTAAQPRNAIVRSSSMRHHSTPPVATIGTRASAQMATPKPIATQAAAGRGMLRVRASAACASMSTPSQP